MKGASCVTAKGRQHRTATRQAEGLSWTSCPQDTPDTCPVGTRHAGACGEEPAKHTRGRQGGEKHQPPGTTGMFQTQAQNGGSRELHLERAPRSHVATGHAVTLGTS